MDEFEFYQDLYHKENDRKAIIDNLLAIPIAVLTAIFSYIIALGSTFDFSQYSKAKYLVVIFVILWSISATFLLFCLYFMTKCFIGRHKAYSGITYAVELQNWKRELVDYYKVHLNENDETSEKKALEAFKKFLLDSYVTHVDNNMLINDQKAKNLYLGKRFLVFSIITSLILTIPFSINFFGKDKEKHKVEIVSLPSMKEMTKKIDKLDKELKVLKKENIYLKNVSYETK